MNPNNQNPINQNLPNLILAMVLSSLIIFGWQYFFPTQIAQPVVQTQGQSTTAPAAAVVKPVTRDEAIAAGPRVQIVSPELTGSVNLTGARIDDLHLVGYRETVKKDSPTIALLTPSGAPHAYFADHGMLPAAGENFKFPDGKTVWTAQSGATLSPETPLVLTYDNGAGLVFTKKITLSNKYLFTMEHSVKNNTALTTNVVPYARVQRQDLPLIQNIWVFYEGMLGVQNSTLQEVKYDAVAKPDGKVETASVGGWVGFTDNYWATAIIPDPKLEHIAGYKYEKQGERDSYQVDYIAKTALPVAAGAVVTYTDSLFAGPKVVRAISDIGAAKNIDRFDLMLDWGWFPYLTKPMFYMLELANSWIGNFGLAIMLVTVFVKLLLFPLANKSYASMSKMKNLQPQMEAIKAANPDDKMKQQQEVMELYKREKVSPLAGCLPVLIQIPIFFALYKVIYTTIELRHAPFFGWIQDLAAPDPTSLFNLFGLLPFSVPTILLIGVFPLLMGVTMWIQMRLNPTPPDPIQAAMFNWMPVIFTFTLGGFPAGLVIYWAWSNFLSIIQQAYIMKKHGTKIDLLGNMRDSLPFLKKKDVKA